MDKLPAPKRDTLRDPLRCDFAVTLCSLIQKSALSGYRLAELAGLGRPHVWRLSKGKIPKPRPETVLKLCLALYTSLKIELHELDLLLMAAGYRPMFAIADAA